MSRRAVRLLTRLAVSLYRLILRFYPAAFRERCGEPMLQTFEQLCATHVDRGRVLPFLRESAAEMLDAVRGIPRAYRGERSLPPIPRGNVARDSSLGSLAQDCSYAVRRLRAQPSVVFFTVLTLGFAIAANAAIFSIVDAVMLRPSPFKDPERIVSLMNRGRNGGSFPGLSREKLRHWRTQTDIFEAVEGYRRTTVLVSGGVEPQELPAAYVSPGLLHTLGVGPRAGRLFAPTEGRAGEEHAVIVSERYWRARLGADPAAVGRTLTVNGAHHTIVGVMPERFNFPTLREQLWLPLDLEARSSRGGGIVEIVARLQKDLTPEIAIDRINVVVAALETQRPLPTGWAIALHGGIVNKTDERTTRTVLVLFGAVALVLLTACANVANLLLSRAVERYRELAIRLVLGATRARIFRELLIEGLLLGLAAGAVGLLAANWALTTLVSLAPEDLVYATSSSITVDGRVFGFTLAISLLTGVLCNLAPALRTARTNGTQALAGRTRTSTETPLQRRLRAALVVAEVALAVVLLVGAALMVRTFVKLNGVDVGFDPDNVLVVTIGLDSQRYGSEESRVRFLEHVAGDVAALPGASGVAITAGVPPAPGTLGLADLETERGRCGDDSTQIVANVVDSTYFGLMGMRVSDGRPLRDDDPRDTVVVSRSLAAQCGSTLIGKRLRLGSASSWLHVVGIVEDVKSFGITDDAEAAAIYFPLGVDPAHALPILATMHERRVVSRHLLVRSERPLSLTESIKGLVWARDPDQPILNTSLATDLMGETIRRERFMLALMTLFSAVALALASAGIFGVLAYSVAQRTNEIGIRMALGASSANVLRLVVGQGLRLAASGAVVGLAGAFAASRVLSGLLYEVDPHDPAAFVSMPLLVFVVALLASWIPTRRAIRVDPASALRVE